MVEAAIRGGAVLFPSFFGLLAIAALIGAVGILTNSQILIVGAMVVGPEYGAIIAVALGISKGQRDAIRDGLLALAVGFSAAIVVTVRLRRGRPGGGPGPGALPARHRPVSDLINSGLMWFSVVGGVLPTGPRGALIGVFISVTTIPAAADIGLSVAFGSWSEAGGSAQQLLLNVVLLIAVGAGGLSAQRALWARQSPRKRPG